MSGFNIPYRVWQLKRGDTWSWELPVTLKGTPYNTSGCTFWLTAKLDKSDLDVSNVFQIGTSTGAITSIGPSADGLMSVKVPATITQGLTPGVTLFYDVQITLANGEVYTLEEGEFDLSEDITDRLV